MTILYIVKYSMDLLTYLPDSDKDDLIWKHIDDVVFKKYTQYTDDYIKIELNNNDICSIKIETPFCKEQNHNINREQNVNKNNINREQYHNINREQIVNKNNINKEQTKSPLNIIVEITENTLLNADYIKDRLKETISKKNYIKVFGLKKSSEILSAITTNKWCKSYALFISYLLDIAIIYEEKEIKFYKDKKYTKTITI